MNPAEITAEVWRLRRKSEATEQEADEYQRKADQLQNEADEYFALAKALEKQLSAKEQP